MEIRAASEDDRADWLALWRLYCDFYEVELPGEVVAATWARIVDPDSAIGCLVAVDDDGRIVGFCNHVLHPNTWSDRAVCYLEDLYVHEDVRRLGVGTRLIDALTDMGRREGWFRIYWITNSGNDRARAAYDRVAKQSDHVRYEIAL